MFEMKIRRLTAPLKNSLNIKTFLAIHKIFFPKILHHTNILAQTHICSWYACKNKTII